MPNTKDMPYLANYPELRDWLHKHEFQCMWQTTVDRKPLSTSTTAVELWLAPNGSPVILTIEPYGHGWDVFTPLLNNDIPATLVDAEKRLGLTE